MELITGFEEFVNRMHEGVEDYPSDRISVKNVKVAKSIHNKVRSLQEEIGIICLEFVAGVGKTAVTKRIKDSWLEGTFCFDLKDADGFFKEFMDNHTAARSWTCNKKEFQKFELTAPSKQDSIFIYCPDDNTIWVNETSARMFMLDIHWA